jgi:hypothetical protein
VVGLAVGAANDNRENKKPWGEVIEAEGWKKPEIKATPLVLILKDSSNVSGKFWFQRFSKYEDTLTEVIVVKHITIL